MDLCCRIFVEIGQKSGKTMLSSTLCKTISADNEVAKREELKTVTLQTIRLKLKAHKNLFLYKYLFSWWVFLKFHTEHGSCTVVLCAKFQKDSSTNVDIMGRWGFTRFPISKSYRCYIEMVPWFLLTLDHTGVFILVGSSSRCFLLCTDGGIMIGD